MKKFHNISVSNIISAFLVLGFILLPLSQLIFGSSPTEIIDTIMDKDVREAIIRSMACSGLAAILAFAIGTPFAFMLARNNFKGKELLNSIIDLPIMIPHPVIGIALLSIAGRNHWIGQRLLDAGIRLMGTTTGIVAVLLFVGLPFYINAARDGFESVPERLEKAARTLGANRSQTFFRVTFPLAWKSLLTGMIMCMARALSEFGAVVIIAYHPMVAPVLMYERFTAYGLSYSRPVAIWLIALSLVLFAALRLLSRGLKGKKI
ncbi:tungstate/molybdate transport system permease protein [Maridesulfovibrio ferrireducens]|uniref:Tungstate/molybdate transport system permease protein n=1 Tax=Maridesulfovibrio ferrireducens TaxID=246191 RepID=A0A1G9FX88_9BACT|nr:ABC transporter permease [Maridesulfovibrio ferrireducens]SDK92935.1 tungstate/molybdate transport system permease protein [Maridesulfovibrio ferrireducens]